MRFTEGHRQPAQVRKLLPYRGIETPAFGAKGTMTRHIAVIGNKLLYAVAQEDLFFRQGKIQVAPAVLEVDHDASKAI